MKLGGSIGLIDSPTGCMKCVPRGATVETVNFNGNAKDSTCKLRIFGGSLKVTTKKTRMPSRLSTHTVAESLE